MSDEWGLVSEKSAVDMSGAMKKGDSSGRPHRLSMACRDGEGQPSSQVAYWPALTQPRLSLEADAEANSGS